MMLKVVLMRSRTSVTLILHLSSKAVCIITFFLLIKLQSVGLVFFPLHYLYLGLKKKVKVMVYKYCAVDAVESKVLQKYILSCEFLWLVFTVQGLCPFR